MKKYKNFLWLWSYNYFIYKGSFTENLLKGIPY